MVLTTVSFTTVLFCIMKTEAAIQKKILSACTTALMSANFLKKQLLSTICLDLIGHISSTDPWRHLQKNKKGKPLIIKLSDLSLLSVYQIHWLLTAAGSSHCFTTGNSCSVCHMCSRHQQSRKLLGSDPYLPHYRVYFLSKRAERCGYCPALKP